jgi:PhzF family phenazine biosynthesis protein
VPEIAIRVVRAMKYFVVDAFTERAFGGNPAAVVLLERWVEDALLQDMAMEMNLSETAFLVPQSGGYQLRWFTPRVEVELCGHATLASAAVLGEVGKLAEGARVAFSTKSGVLTAERRAGRMILDFPAMAVEQVEPPAGLAEALGAELRFVGKSQFDLLVEVATEREVREMRPDLTRLAGVKCRGVIVTAASEDARFDFVSRFFAPAVGIDEDPVTGSAHCVLAPWWGRRLGKTVMVGHQVSRRGGVVEVEVRGERVMLGGSAVVVARGEMDIRSRA